MTAPKRPPEGQTVVFQEGQVADMLTRILAQQADMLVEMSNMGRELRQASSEQATAILEAAKQAFPAGDAEGHRRAHEAMIERVAELRKLRIAIAEKTLIALIWVSLIWLGTAVWNQFRSGLH